MKRFLFGASAIVLSVAPAQAQDAELTAWKKYLLALHDYVCGASDPCTDVQLPTTTIEAEWGPTSLGQLSLHVIADPIPNGGMLFRRSARSLGAEYQKFVDNIDYVAPEATPAERKQAGDTEAAYKKATSAYATIFSNNTDGWNKFDQAQSSKPEPQRLTRDQWAEKFAPNEHAASLASAEAQDTYDGAVQRIFPGQTGVSLRIAKKGPPVLNVKDEAGNTLRVYPYLIDSSLSKFKQDAASAFNGDKMQPEQWITVSASRSTVDFEKKTGGGSIGVDFQSFGVNLAGQKMSFSRLLTSENKSIQVGYGRTKTFTITPGEWYQSGLISSFVDGPFKKKPNKPYFGPDGSIPARALEVVVGYRPTVVIELTADELKEAQEYTSGGGGFRIGPVRIGGSGSKLKYSKVESDSSNSYQLFDDSDRAYIIAIRSLPLP